MKAKIPVGLLRTILAVLPPLVAFMLQWMFWPYIQPYVWFLFYPAVFFSSWIGGLSGGLAATAISTALVLYFFIPPEFSFAVENPKNFLSVGVFMGMGVLFSLFHDRLRRTTRQAAEALVALRSANEQLESHVLERTAELARTNESLRASEARFQTIVENLDEGVAVSDLDGQLLHFNRAALDMHGFASLDECRRQLSEFAGTFELSAPDGTILPVDQWPLARILRGETLRDLEIRIRRIRNGWQRIFTYGGTLVRDTDGQPTIAVVTISDITERAHAEQEIARQRAFLRQVIDLDRNFIFAKDREGRFTLVNQAVAEAYGTTVENLVGKTDGDFNPNRDEIEHFRRDDLEVMDGLTEKIVPEEKITDASGRVRWLQTVKRPIIGSHGRAEMILGVATDFTERKLAEEAARESQERYRMLFNTLIEGFCIIEVLFDADGRPIDYRFLEINSAFEAQTGLRNAQGKRMRELAPDHEEHWFSIYGKIALTGESARFVNEAKALNRWYDVSAYRVGGPDSRKVAILFNDITELKRAEQRVRGQLEHLNLLDHITRAIGERQDLRSIFQVVVRSLEDSLPIDFGCVGLYDPAAHALRATCAGAKSAVFAHELTNDEQVVIDVDDNGLSRCIEGQLVYEADIREVPFPFPQRLARAGLGSLVMAPLRAESKVFGVLVAARREVNAFSSVECEFLRQLSEHVALAAHQAQLYGALQQAYDDLRQTQQAMMQEERLRALGQMASGIAHDINNALSPVSLYTESLLETERNLSERARGYLETIQRAVEDVAQTVGRMREFYRPRAAQLVLTPVQPNTLVQQVLELTRARWSDQPQQSGIVIRALTELAPDLPKIMAVESEIREALTNLVFNAVDAMPEGGTLMLRTRVTDADPERAAVVVEVADTGIGMDEVTRQRCLEPFFTTKGERGTGMGLAMVFGMVQRHSAELEIESAPGAGTTVRLVFAVPTAIMAEPGRPAAMAVPSRLRLLLIDDDPVLLKALRDALETDGHVVVTANGGEAGITAFRMALERGEPFAAVFTDLGMPKVDGRKVAVAVKEASPATPVILLTGWGQRLVSEGDIPPHVDRVLAKPPKLRELREALAQLCRPAEP